MKKMIVPIAVLFIGLTLAAAEVKLKDSTITPQFGGPIPPPCWPILCEVQSK